MPNPFPIIPAIDAISFIFLFILTVHLWRRRKEITFSAFKSFTWFFTFITAMIFILSLPGLVVKDELRVQSLFNIADIFLYGALALFTRTLGLLFSPRNRFFTLTFPIFLVFLGISSVIWKMLYLLPTKIFLVEGTSFLLYRDTSPFLPNAILGILSLLLFGLGSVVFFLQVKKAKDPFLRRRSLLFGFGFAVGVLASISTYIFNFFPGQLFFSTLSAIFLLASLSLVWLAIQTFPTSQ